MHLVGMLVAAAAVAAPVAVSPEADQIVHGGPARAPLAVGGSADWIVVSADPLSCTDGALVGLGVHRTVAGGVVVFDDGLLE